METQKTPKNPVSFCCEKCNFNSLNKKDYGRHLQTKKHMSMSMEMGGNCLEIKKPQSFICENCDKEFKTNSGLWKHNKICKISNDNNIDNKDDIIMLLIKENSDFKKMLMEQQNMMLKIMEKGINNTDSHDTNTNTHNTNSHNKAFNLQFYLNETCKNAMNLSEFIDSIHPQLSDLISVGELGYVEGMSKIIIDNLNKLDFTERPINCTDKKRDVVYVKDDNKWEKDDENRKKMRYVIKQIAYKNQQLLPLYRHTYPDCVNYYSSYSDKYNRLIVEALGGSSDNDIDNEDKIIKNIAKEIYIKRLQ